MLTPILALNEPAVVTSSYEVLEPETWVGKKLPILQHIDIGEKLSRGNWLILLYHHDCPDCAKAIAKPNTSKWPAIWPGMTISCELR